jgi:uncharacterized protein YraI
MEEKSMNRKILIGTLVLALAALSACNLPGQPPATAESESTFSQEELVATMVAATLAAQSPTGETPQPPTETPTPENTATITLTPTPEVPTASVSVNTNCRTGPSTQFDLIGALTVGQTAEVVGKYQNGAYWIIKTPGSSGNCWLWGNYATVSGNTSNLPEYPSPPTPTPSITPTPMPPAAASNLTANKACNNAGAPVGFTYAGGNIAWQDNSDNETGFNVYIGANLAGTTAPNVTTYPIPPLLVTVGQPITMGVEAINSGGASAKVEITFSCP